MQGKKEKKKSHTYPVPDIQKALLICQIKEQKKPHGISEESCSQATKPRPAKRN